MNSTDAVKPAHIAAVSAKGFQSVYCTSAEAISMVYCPVVFTVASHFAIRHFKSRKPSQSVAIDGATGNIVNGCYTNIYFYDYIYLLFIFLIYIFIYICIYTYKYMYFVY
jgi:hypothetical protein